MKIVDFVMFTVAFGLNLFYFTLPKLMPLVFSTIVSGLHLMLPKNWGEIWRVLSIRHVLGGTTMEFWVPYAVAKTIVVKEDRAVDPNKLAHQAKAVLSWVFWVGFVSAILHYVIVQLFIQGILCVEMDTTAHFDWNW
jgi:hypothetical protein